MRPDHAAPGEPNLRLSRQARAAIACGAAVNVL